jgi:hypothetical protein
MRVKKQMSTPNYLDICISLTAKELCQSQAYKHGQKGHFNA